MIGSTAPGRGELLVAAAPAAVSGPGARAVVVGAIAVLVVGMAAGWRRRWRIRRRLAVAVGAPARSSAAVAVAGRALSRLGRLAHRDGIVGAGRGHRLGDRGRGLVVVTVVVGAAVVHPVLGLVVAAAVVGPPALHRRRARRRRAEAVVEELPEVVELLHLAVSAGLNLRLALDVVVAHGDGHCAEALAGVVARVERGQRLVDGLDVLDGLGAPARPLRDALVAAERYGTPLLEPLARVADDVRVRRRQRRDERARRLPVALLFPLVCCTLPALALVTVVPVVARPWLGSSP